MIKLTSSVLNCSKPSDVQCILARHLLLDAHAGTQLVRNIEGRMHYFLVHLPDLDRRRTSVSSTHIYIYINLSGFNFPPVGNWSAIILSHRNGRKATSPELAAGMEKV